MPENILFPTKSIDIITLDENFIDTNEKLKKLLIKYGPIYATINDTNFKNGDINGQPKWNSTGLPQIAPCNDVTLNNNPNHAIVIIGWGTSEDSSVEQCLNNNNQYWIIKNDWGTDWAWNGYTAIPFLSNPSNIFEVMAVADITNNKIFNDPNSIWDSLPSTKIDTTHTINPDTFKFNIDRNTNLARSINTRRKPVTRYSGYVKFDDIWTQPELQAQHPTLAKSINTLSINIDKINIPKKFTNFLNWGSSYNPIGQSILDNIHNQGKCNSCWIFTCLDIITSALAKRAGELNKTVKIVTFSVQHIINNLEVPESCNQTQNTCENGGNSLLFHQYINGIDCFTQHNLVLAKNCPYVEKNACGKKNQDGCDTKTSNCMITTVGAGTKLNTPRVSNTNKVKTGMIILFSILTLLFISIAITIYVKYNIINLKSPLKYSIIISLFLFSLISLVLLILYSIRIL